MASSQGNSASVVSRDAASLAPKLGTLLEAPALPTHVSSNGAEIWDWAARLSEHTQRLGRIRQLRADLRRLGMECGDCDKWMKSRECPRERNVNGQTRGPSMTALVCGQYVEAASTTKRRVELEAALSGEVRP